MRLSIALLALVRRARCPRSSTPPRPPPTATARKASTTTTSDGLAASAAEPYGWTKALFDRSSPSAPARRLCAAPMGGAEVLQRLRAERRAQGPDALGRPQIWPSAARASRCPLQVAPADYADGGQLRDFVYVRDCVDVSCGCWSPRRYAGLTTSAPAERAACSTGTACSPAPHPPRGNGIHRPCRRRSARNISISRRPAWAQAESRRATPSPARSRRGWGLHRRYLSPSRTPIAKAVSSAASAEKSRLGLGLRGNAAPGGKHLLHRHLVSARGQRRAADTHHR